MAIYQDDKLVKRAYRKVAYTKEQIDELRACMDPVTGPLYFISNFMYVQHPKLGKQKLKLFDYQIKLLENYSKYRKSVNMLGRQLGKALSLNTPILTPTGFTELGNLCVGDVIYGPDGKSTTITFITDTMHDHECYIVEFDNGETIIADKDHLWTVVVNGINQTLTTENIISILDTKKVYIPLTKPVEFESCAVDTDPYEYGLYIALSEGSIDTNTFKIDIKDTDSDKQSIKSISREYIFNSVENRLSLLRGLMDSAGDCNGNFYSFSHSDLNLAEQVRFLLSTLGIKTQITQQHGVYTITFATSAYSIFRNSKKINTVCTSAENADNNRVYFSKIEKTSSVPVRCLQVNNTSHLFLAGKTLVPTHNTTVASGYLLWYAMFMDDATVLIASNKYDGAQEIMHRVRYAYECIPDHIRAGVKTYNKRSIDFDNGSRIIATTTTENTGRGMSLSLVYLDEFAFVEPNIAKEFWTSLSPTLSTGGKCIITSTPNTDEDQFADIWFGANKMVDANGNETEVGVNGFRPYIAIWDSHPDRDQAWADSEIAAIGFERFEREHACCDQSTLVTIQDQTGAVFDISIGNLYNKLKFYAQKEYSCQFSEYFNTIT